MCEYQFFDDQNHRGYFPSHKYSSTVQYDQNDSLSPLNYYGDWDYFTYYEPQYQWINFKRNSQSHYNMDTQVHFDYTNETYLVPGKGYMLATAEETYLQCYGTLNNGDVSIPLTKSGEERKGINFLGNPYQSYLDFQEFAVNNAFIWGGNRNNADYIIMDEDCQGYLHYAVDASRNLYTAPRYLHPHQGFMVVTDNEGSAVFTNEMRSATSQGSTFRGDEQPAYPLVNLLAYDENGNRDLTTIELGRPDKGGAYKRPDLRMSTGLIYAHYEDEDYSIVFTQPGITSIPIRFETVEDAVYTMKWDTENGTFSYLHLIDNLLGVDIDCLRSDEYRFSSSINDYKSRFKLVFDYTGVEENDSDINPNETFAFCMGGNLVVNGEGNLEIIDIAGHVLSVTRIDGTQSVVALPKVASGLYMLRLSSEKGVKVQKIIIQ